MANTIAGISAPSDTGTAVAATVSMALQANVDAAETANAQALFGSLGLGAKVNATA